MFDEQALISTKLYKMENQESKHQSEENKKKEKEVNNEDTLSNRPLTDPEEATERKNQDSDGKEQQTGDSKSEADFENPDDDPA